MVLRINDPNVTAIEVQEVLVDWYEAGTEHEYEVEEEDNLKDQ